MNPHWSNVYGVAGFTRPDFNKLNLVPVFVPDEADMDLDIHTPRLKREIISVPGAYEPQRITEDSVGMEQGFIKICFFILHPNIVSSHK